MTAAEARCSPYWPADVTESEGITDKYCPLAIGFILKRRKGPAVYVTNPHTTEIEYLSVIDMEDADRILQEMFPRVLGIPWRAST